VGEPLGVPLAGKRTAEKMPKNQESLCGSLRGKEISRGGAEVAGEENFNGFSNYICFSKETKIVIIKRLIFFFLRDLRVK
jgi:hypothetical protein